jgi:hypothetical protein
VEAVTSLSERITTADVVQHPCHQLIFASLALPRNVSRSSFLVIPCNLRSRVSTMILSWLLFCFIRGASSADSAVEVAWYSAPNYRGTWDLIVSCVLTLMICVWSALHLNVPVKQSKLKDRNVRRLRWILLGIFAPEVVVSTAFAQYLTARWLLNEIRGDIEYRKNLVSLPFSVTTSYFDEYNTHLLNRNILLQNLTYV